eukprot:3545682-Pyramimonas_sp.AAC.1
MRMFVRSFPLVEFVHRAVVDVGATLRLGPRQRVGARPIAKRRKCHGSRPSPLARETASTDCEER